MAIPKTIHEFLERRNVKYAHNTHAVSFTARQLAEVDHVPAREVAKTVVFIGDGCYALAVLPADETVDMDKLKSALGLTEVRLATENEMKKLFPDCEVGAMPPFGNLFGIPVYVDDRLTRQETIEFNAGTHCDTVRMRFAEFSRLVKPVTTRFGHLNAA